MNSKKESGFSKRQRAMIMIPLLTGGFIALLNETILNVAFPQLMTDLHVSTSTIQWLATAYMLVIGILVPVVAFLLKTFSTKKLYLTAMILFTIGTIFCGFSQSFGMLLISRIIQGAGTGMLIPIMMNTILEIFPISRRGAAIGLGMMIVVVAPGIGPTLSGIVLQYLNWHWLFFFILPFAFIATALGIISLKNVTTLTKPKIDAISIALSTIGFGGLIFGISLIENEGFASPMVATSLFCGVLGLVLFSKRQLALKQPMLELRVFKHPQFTLGSILIFITFMLPFAVNIILPTYTQSVLGLLPIAAGLAMLPGSLINGFIAPLSGRLYDRVGARLLTIFGFTTLIISMLFLSNLNSSTTLVAIIVLQSCMLVGVGFIFTPLQTNSLNQLPKKYNVHGVAIINTIQQVSAAFGSSLFIGIVGSIQANRLGMIKSPEILQQKAAIVTGVNAAFSAALVMVIIGLFLSFSIKHYKKASTQTQESEAALLIPN